MVDGRDECGMRCTTFEDIQRSPRTMLFDLKNSQTKSRVSSPVLKRTAQKVIYLKYRSFYMLESEKLHHYYIKNYHR